MYEEEENLQVENLTNAFFPGGGEHSKDCTLIFVEGNLAESFAGGEDQSAPRYLHIELSPITRLIFPDDESSDQQGKEVKPGRYFPIIPMVIVNGCEGIGVGWNISVPSYYLINIIKNIMYLIDSKGNVSKLPVKIRSWYKGFHGRIEGSQSSGDDYTSYCPTPIPPPCCPDLAVVSNNAGQS
ncbi:hypothetical protein C1H46_026947 [Malus baccata]|uniref:DNA topoisomerase (ATP-hydrolyzing) n=1 Tax=Malus baccata TaxID=106549 RepID=A0A540LM31_MALBA|nr:hypothetical protein C1H46_026947 [Malus baccata]